MIDVDPFLTLDGRTASNGRAFVTANYDPRASEVHAPRLPIGKRWELTSAANRSILPIV
jgi:hypothetical protein